MKAHVKKAAEDGLHGVVAIHWRTEEIKLNFATFSRFAKNPADKRSVEQIYRDFCSREYGTCAADHLTPLLVSADTAGLLNGITSAVYFAYTPFWGRLNPGQAGFCRLLIEKIDDCLSNENDQSKRANLSWLKAVYEFTLLLDEVSRCMEPVWKMRESYLTGNKGITEQQICQARDSLANAPIEAMISTFASRIRSRGELGELASVNQRVWGEYKLLSDFTKKCYFYFCNNGITCDRRKITGTIVYPG